LLIIPAYYLLIPISLITIRTTLQFPNLQINFLLLNFEKTHYIHFITKNNPTINMKTGYGNKLIPNILRTKFLVINIYSTLFWKTHIGKLISQLSIVCYVIRSIKPYMSHTTLIMVYYSLFHAIMNYGLIHNSVSDFPQRF
jgi:hypothetical protein